MKIGTLCLLVLLSPVASAQEEALSSRDFAYGMSLEVDGDGAIYSMPLPPEVYRFTTRSDLGDVRIFNGYGEVVPHLLQRGKTYREKRREPVALRFFPLSRDEPWDSQVKRIHIADDGRGTIIDIERQPGEEAKPGPVDHYLVDATAVDAPVEKLLLDWGETGQRFLTSIKVEYSNDLVHWQHLVAAATLADLSYEGHRLSEKTIPLPLQEARYYRISWPLGEKGVQLQSIRAGLKPAVDEPSRQWIMLPASDEEEPGVYRFTLPGHYPVDRIQVELPQANTVARAWLYSRGKDEKAPWRLRFQGLLYNLMREGHTLQNEAIALGGISDSQWRLDVAQEGGGLGSGQPRLRMGWVPHRLLFVARGEMPFTLSFGAATVKPPGSDIAALVARLEKEQGGEGFIKLAHVGGLFELGGERRLRPPAPPVPWKRWVLWAVLLIGVALLAWMGRSLYRQMNLR